MSANKRMYEFSYMYIRMDSLFVDKRQLQPAHNPASLAIGTYLEKHAVTRNNTDMVQLESSCQVGKQLLVTT